MHLADPQAPLAVLGRTRVAQSVRYRASMEACFESDFEDVPYEAVRTFPAGTRLGNDLTITGILGEGGTAIVYCQPAARCESARSR